MRQRTFDRAATVAALQLRYLEEDREFLRKMGARNQGMTRIFGHDEIERLIALARGGIIAKSSSIERKG